jgi:hypothetical protein
MKINITLKISILCFLINAYQNCFTQDSEGKFLTDSKTGCTVWFKHTFPEDSVSWNGKCLNNLATGKGTMIGYTKGKQTSTYSGYMLNGKPHGMGAFTFGNNRKLVGNFLNGEPLFLKNKYLKYLNKHIISETDTSELYDGDNNLKQLYYHALIPAGAIKGAIILMPGTWQTTEHLISSTQTLQELAFKNNLAVLSLSINQRLTLTDEIVIMMNKMISDAIIRYQIPKNNIVMGGWSMGGLFSLRYTELSRQDSSKTVIQPIAVFSCDGPCDLENIYHMFQLKLEKYPDNNEALYGINELEKYCGGSPSEAKTTYQYYSCYSHSEKDGGNAKYLLSVPVRIYNDLDANWWMQNRGLDMYYMNGLDQTAMIQQLNDMGNNKAQFINAFQKGYRIEGNRHPHSWSIVEPNDCIKWILETLNTH